MAMSNEEIARLLAQALPGAGIDVQGDGYKYQVQIVSPSFAGLSRVKRQQAVYKVLNDHIRSGEIHAVNMALQTPEEAALAASPAREQE
jgi:acid stress-induced BolA-like protein IbaG/YrbA